MAESGLHIYLDKIPFSEGGAFWVSFESHPRLQKSKANIYERCLPCIQNLYYQLKDGLDEIDLGRAYVCWKVTAVVPTLEDALCLLAQMEKDPPLDYIYGKLGTGKSATATKAVVFHAEGMKERELLEQALRNYASRAELKILDLIVSRGCASLHEELFGPWNRWGPATRVKHPDKVPEILEKIKKMLFWWD